MGALAEASFTHPLGWSFNPLFNHLSNVLMAYCLGQSAKALKVGVISSWRDGSVAQRVHGRTEQVADARGDPGRG